MASTRIIFQGLRINTDLFAPDEGYTNTLVVYDMETGAQGFAQLFARVRHPAGDLDPAGVTVEPQLTFKGPFDKAGFAREAREYYLEFARRPTAAPSAPTEEVFVVAVKAVDLPEPAAA